jgi:hypothetical protein
MWLMSSILFYIACMHFNLRSSATDCYFVAEATHKSSRGRVRGATTEDTKHFPKKQTIIQINNKKDKMILCVLNMMTFILELREYKLSNI